MVRGACQAPKDVHLKAGLGVEGDEYSRIAFQQESPWDSGEDWIDCCSEPKACSCCFGEDSKSHLSFSIWLLCFYFASNCQLVRDLIHQSTVLDVINCHDIQNFPKFQWFPTKINKSPFKFSRSTRFLVTPVAPGI